MIIQFSVDTFRQDEYCTKIADTFGAMVAEPDADFNIWKDLVLVLTRDLSGKLEQAFMIVRTPAGELWALANLPGDARVLEEA